MLIVQQKLASHGEVARALTSGRHTPPKFFSEVLMLLCKLYEDFAIDSKFQVDTLNFLNLLNRSSGNTWKRTA
jgi:hypothetical protein